MEFDSPLRVTWTAGRASPFARVAAALTDAAVREVSLCAPLDVIQGRTADLARLAQASRVDLSVDARHLGDEEGTLALETLLRGGLVAGLAFDFTAVGESEAVRLLARLGALVQSHPPVALAVAAHPDARNLSPVLRLAAAAAEAGIPEVRLLHPDLCDYTTGAICHPLNPAALAEARALFPTGWPFPNCRLLVHDLFLARLLLGGAPAAYGGCQAGGALAHVDSDGRVYPCSALPVYVGNLRQQDLQSIWASAEARAIRRRLAQPPRACTGCSAAPTCRGGCRGLSYTVSHSWDEPDPACSGPADQPSTPA